MKNTDFNTINLVSNTTNSLSTMVLKGTDFQFILTTLKYAKIPKSLLRYTESISVAQNYLETKISEYHEQMKEKYKGKTDPKNNQTIWGKDNCNFEKYNDEVNNVGLVVEKTREVVELQDYVREFMQGVVAGKIDEEISPHMYNVAMTFANR